MPDVIAGRIELLDPIARGATGSVWTAIDRRFGAICAAKLMRHRDGADVLRFVREQAVGRSAGSIRSHPHLVLPYTWVAEDDTIVLVMPLVRGGTLAGAVADNGPFGTVAVTEVLAGLLDGLGAVHAAGWVHRDVKPANVLLSARDGLDAPAPLPLLADFGIALHERDIRLTETGVVPGTPGFVAPEVTDGHGAGPSQDVWAAAATAVHCLDPRVRLTGAEDAGKVLRDLDALRTRDVITDRLGAVLQGLLCPDPSRRPSALEARRALVLPGGGAHRWWRTADGEDVMVFDLVSAHIPPDVLETLPLVPISGPGSMPPRAAGLHDRLDRAARPQATEPEAAEPENVEPADDEPEDAGRAGDGDAGVAPARAIAPHRPPGAAGTSTPAAGSARQLLARRLAPVLLLVIGGCALVLAAILLALALRGPGTASTPASSAAETGTATTNAATATGSSPSASAGAACSWDQEGRRAQAADGQDLVCTRTDQGTYEWTKG